jgi:hypothetical protein
LCQPRPAAVARSRYSGAPRLPPHATICGISSIRARAGVDFAGYMDDFVAVSCSSMQVKLSHVTLWQASSAAVVSSVCRRMAAPDLLSTSSAWSLYTTHDAIATQHMARRAMCQARSQQPSASLVVILLIAATAAITCCCCCGR